MKAEAFVISRRLSHHDGNTTFKAREVGLG
jgi:hypothetical protein